MRQEDRDLRVLFVTEDDTCLGPAACAIFKTVTAEETLTVKSRGLVVLFSEPLNPRILEVMKEHGIGTVRSFSKPLQTADLRDNTLVLTMTLEEKKSVQKRFPLAARVERLSDFVGQYGDVLTPHGNDASAFAECYERIDLLTKLAAEIITGRTES